MGQRFVIGDVHGCARTLRTLVEERLGLTREDELYLLGDLIDRGPAVREVLEYIIGLREAGYAVASVMGNPLASEAERKRTDPPADDLIVTMRARWAQVQRSRG